MPLHPLFVCLALLAPLPTSAARQAARDAAPVLMRARAQRDLAGAPPQRLGSVGAGNRLFHMDGADNAE